MTPDTRAASAAPRTAPLWLLILLQAVVSAASLVVEIVAGRMLAPHVGMSLYTWTSVIAVVLAGFSAGHWWGGRIAARAPDRAQIATGWTMIAAALSTGGAVWLLAHVAVPVLGAVGHPVWGIAVLTTAVFFLPSLFAGVPAPVLARIAVEGTEDAGPRLGAIFAAGALGAIAGTLLAGFLFISWLGSNATLGFVSLAYLATALLFFHLGGMRPGLWPALAAALTLALAASAFAAPTPCTRESRYFCIRTIDVSADPAQPVRLMVIDHLGHGMGARDLPRVLFTEHGAMLDGLARMRMPDTAFSGFFIGGGTYSVPRAWAERGIGPVTVAEIDPEVTEIAARDFWYDPNGAEILHQDARRALLERPDRDWDVLVGDAFTDVAVPAHLVTREFFELVRDRLTPRGIYLMNVIDYEDRLHALGALTATLRAVFPTVEIWTEARPPAPGERMVFVILAAQSPSQVAQLRLRAPDPTVFAALEDATLDRIVAAAPVILTDDFAPIDRLIGRPD